MTFRIRRVITGAFVCHLLLVPGLLTSQLLTPASDQFAPQEQLSSSRQTSPTESGEPVTIRARQQEKTGAVYSLKGEVEIEFRDLVVQADEITYDTDSGLITANGHFSVDDQVRDAHVEASHGTYNVKDQSGKFYDVVGTAGVRFRGKNVTLVSDEPFTFTGKIVERAGPDQYIVYDGTVTSCRLPEPNWTFNAHRIVVNTRGNAKIYNTTLRLRKVPVVYFPYAAHPFSKLGRQSGFLVPTFGTSSRKGTIIGDSFYWAINRSYDATVGAEYFSSRGWAQHGEFRGRPSEKSNFDAVYFGVVDRGLGSQQVDQGGEDVKINGETLLPHDVRGVASIEYLSSFIFRQAFTDTFTQAVNSEVKSLLFASKSYNGFFLNALGGRYQNFHSNAEGDLITIWQAPSLQFVGVDQQFAKTPFYWAFSAAAEGVSRREPTFKTDALVGRFDLSPRLSLPLFFRGWALRPELALRNTYYTQRKNASVGVGSPLDAVLNRRAVDANVELRLPTLGRIFEKTVFGRTVKHTFEPRVSYRVVNGVSGFQNVIRFDQQDILSDTSELEYAFVQHLYLKKPQAGCENRDSHNHDSHNTDPARACDTGAHEFITWELAQRYYLDPTFGSALVSGRRNVFTSSVDFTGIAFLTEPRRFSPLVSRLRVRATENADISWQVDYDTTKTRINASSVFANYRLGDFFFGGSHAFFHAPGEIFVNNPIPSPEQFNQFRILGGYGGPSKRGVSMAAGIGFDAGSGFLQYGSLQSSYNWDCCGVSLEYRRFALGTVRNENQFRFSLTLANIGTFGNMRRQDKLF